MMNDVIKQKLKFFMFGFSLGALAVVMSFLVSLFVKSINPPEKLTIEILMNGMSGFGTFAVFIVLRVVKNIYNFDIYNKYNLFKLFLPMVLGCIAFTKILILILEQFIQ